LIYNQSENLIWVSTNGASWEKANLGTNGTPSGIAFGNGIFVTVGQGQVLTSSDGHHWFPQQITNETTLSMVDFENGRFVAVGNPGAITSLDGTNWIGGEPLLAQYNSFRHLEAGNGVFVAVVSSFPETSLLTSSDGLIWQKTLTLPGDIGNLVFGNGQFVATRDGGSLLNSSNFVGNVITSVDGFQWHSHTVWNARPLPSLAFASGLFAGVSSTAQLLVSTNAVDWEQKNTPFSRVSKVLGLNNSFLVSGDFDAIYGGIVQSGPFHALAPSIIKQPKGFRAKLGESWALTSDAYGSSPLAFQWYKDSAVLEGATNKLLMLEHIGPESTGTYTLSVQNDLGSTTSAPATILIEPDSVQLLMLPADLQFSPPPVYTSFQVSLQGTLGSTWEIQHSESLSEESLWQPLTSVFIWDTPVNVTPSPIYPSMFFRAVSK
jgi:hypothetical protein